MNDLDINYELIGWTNSFPTERLVELVINEFTNPRQKLGSRIPSRSLVSQILFLIYISEIFSMIEDQLFHVTCLFFIDDPGFLTAY